MLNAERNRMQALASEKLLGYWGYVPNPNGEFFWKAGVSPYRALKDITFVPEVEAAVIAREAAVIGDEFQIVGEDEKAVDFVKENLLSVNPRRVFRSIYEAVWYGFAVLQHPMVKTNGRWKYELIEALPGDWFSFTSSRELVPYNDFEADPFVLDVGDLAKEGELVQYRSSFINPYGESQLARVFWAATWLRGDMEYWVNYITRFGDDSILASTEVSSPQKREELRRAVADFRSSGGMIVDGTDKFEILKTEKTGTSHLFKTFYDTCTEQINKLILGHASALNSTPGKLGNDQGLSIVRQDIMADDKKLIEDTVNNLVAHLCIVNNFKETPSFRWVPEKEDETAKIARDEKLAAMGFKLSEDYIRSAYGFNEGDIRTDVSQTPEGKPESETAAFAEDNGKKPSSRAALNKHYFEDFDRLVERNYKAFTKPFEALNKGLIKALQRAEFWEDAFAESARLGAKAEIPFENFALDLLTSEAIGRNQVLTRLKGLQSVSFADEDAVPYFSTFEEARNWFVKKKVLSNEEYKALDEELKQYAFTVTGLAKTEHTSKVADALLKAYDEGSSYNEFKKSLTGFGEEIAGISETQLQLVYRQNMTSAFAEGRFKQMMQAADIFPNWEYVTAGDHRVRPAHAAMDGEVRRYDDPFWNAWYPPNGFNCRCVVEVTDKEPTGRGIPAWNADLEAKAAEAGSPMKGFDYAGKVLPENGFRTNPAGLSYWIKDKVLESNLLVSRNIAQEVVGARTQILNGRAQTPWDAKKNNISASSGSPSKNKAVEVIEKQLTNNRIPDKFREPVFIDPEYLIEHIERQWTERSKALPLLNKFFEAPAEVWIQLDKYKKRKHIVLSKKYFANIDGIPWMAVVEYAREKSSLPVLTTLYPVNNPDRLKELRTGMLLK